MKNMKAMTGLIKESMIGLTMKSIVYTANTAGLTMERTTDMILMDTTLRHITVKDMFTQDLS